MNNVYFILGGYKGCNYVRGLQPMWENGWNGNKTTIIQDDKSTEVVRRELEDADVVVFHRPEILEFHKLAHLLKSLGKKIVFDNDDTYNLEKEHPFYNFDSYGDKHETSLRNDIVHNFVTNADLVTTTTKTLAKEYSKFNDNVVVLPNCVNPDDWDEPLRNKGKKIRIGVSGSVAFTQDSAVIGKELKWLGDRDDVELVMFGLQSIKMRKKDELVQKIYKKEYEFWDKINFEHAPWVQINEYPETLNELRLDMMLIPRKECYFNKCKSNLKFLETAMCEIPCIVSSFEDAPYEEVPNNCIVRIPSGKSWKDEIDMMINDKDLRREMGKNAKEHTLENFNIKTKAHLWKDEYNKLTK